MKRMRTTLVAGALMAALSSPAYAEFIGNVDGGTDFPQGIASFADAVVGYMPGLEGASPTAIYQDASHARGAPDYPGGTTCSTAAACSWVSLGAGGSLVVRFDDNKLTGSGNGELDLWIFEVGTDVEDTVVEISADGIAWTNVGTVFGATAGIDIDAHGFGTAHQFSYVRLTDVAGEGGTSGATVGADIDAVGAISTVLTPIPEPSTYGLLLAGLGLLGFAARRRP